MRLCRIVCVYRMEDLNVARHMYVAGQAQERKTVRVWGVTSTPALTCLRLCMLCYTDGAGGGAGWCPCSSRTCIRGSVWQGTPALYKDWRLSPLSIHTCAWWVFGMPAFIPMCLHVP